MKTLGLLKRKILKAFVRFSKEICTVHALKSKTNWTIFHFEKNFQNYLDFLVEMIGSGYGSGQLFRIQNSVVRYPH
jgi:hypothetical protein